MSYPSPRLLVSLALAAGCAGPNPERLEFQTPAGITYVVTADGLSEVRLGKRVLAEGGWRFSVGDRRWGIPSGPDAGTISAKTFEIISPTEARVTHTHKQALVRHTITFSGEDVRIDSWVENLHPTAAIQVAVFDGLRIDFGRTPHGILPNWDTTYTASGGLLLMHPGGIRIGGSYGVGDGFGVGAAPHDAGIHPTALLWDWDWQPGKRENDPSRRPNLNVNAAIPARGARTFAITFRFSTDTEWMHLLEPYRRQLHAAVGDKLLYERPSHLPFVRGIVCGTAAQKGPTNPYGFELNRRFDSIYGVSKYHGQISPDMRAIPAQGLVIWGQGGLNSRGAMYRPDFDILPPEVAPNVGRFAGLFKEQGMKFGVAARPGQFTQPLNWTTDTVGRINPAQPDQLELLTSRFQNMMALGASLFYLDSFGNRLDDVVILRAVRTGIGKQKGIGSAVQTFVEFPSDVIIPFSGLLPVLNGSAAKGTLGTYFAGDFWLNPPDTPTMPEVMRYFYADVPIVALVSGATGTDTDEQKKTAVEYCLKRRMTPMIPDEWLGPGSHTVNWLAPLIAKYLTPEGRWRDKPG
jgi:hypothetical protein